MKQEEEYDARGRSSEDGEHGARRGIRCKREEHSAGLWRSLCDIKKRWRKHDWHVAWTMLPWKETSLKRTRVPGNKCIIEKKHEGNLCGRELG